MSNDVQVSFDYNGKRLSRKVSDKNFICLTNNLGDYFIKSLSKPQTRYEGLFFADLFTLYKTISNIVLLPEHPAASVTNYMSYAEMKREKVIEKYWMPSVHGTLVYQLSKQSEVRLDLDIRQPYESVEWERAHEIFEESGCIVIKYRHRGLEMYLAIKGAVEFSTVNEWVNENYDFDKKRNSLPDSRYVYRAVIMKGSNFVFSVSNKKEKAIQKAHYVSEKLSILFREVKSRLPKADSTEEAAAKNAINNFIVKYDNFTGLYAGLPWFFQFWSRDQAISANALQLSGHVHAAKKIMMSQMEFLAHDGRIPNILSKEHFGTASSDSVGWTFFRLSQMELGSEERQKISEFIVKSLELQLQNHTSPEGLAHSGALETWMDTSPSGKNDLREGHPIEIQALRLANYSFAYSLTKKDKWKIHEEVLKQSVRKKFWNKKYINDTANDYTVRPNVFIAYYIYPDLFSKEQWESCFDVCIEALWLNWGGFSTIDKKNKLFIDTYSGETPDSYHRGDSWYWINNLAAICMQRLNKEKYKKYVDKILNASTEEMLWEGAIGNCAELSSAKEQRSEGSLAQAWSAALLVELFEELNVQNKEIS